VVNHLLLIKDIEQNNYDTIDLDRRTNQSMLSKRFFTVQGIQHMESLTLSFADLDLMKKDFEGQSRTFFKNQI